MLFREGQTTRSHSIPRSLIPKQLKSFSEESGFFLSRLTNFVFFPHLVQAAVAGVTNSNDEVSWIVLCNVRYKGQRIA